MFTQLISGRPRPSCPRVRGGVAPVAVRRSARVELTYDAALWVRVLLPIVLKRNHGHMVTIASAAGLTGVAGLGDCTWVGLCRDAASLTCALPARVGFTLPHAVHRLCLQVCSCRLRRSDATGNSQAGVHRCPHHVCVPFLHQNRNVRRRQIGVSATAVARTWCVCSSACAG